MLKKIWRIEQWWAHILPPIMLFYYIGLFSNNINANNIIANAFFLIFISIATGIIGFFINDLFDIKEDAKANKKNYIAQLPFWLISLIIPAILIFLCILFLVFSPYINRLQFRYYLICTLINLSAFIIYSIPPIRLKKMRYLSTIIDALYSGTFFYLLAYCIPRNENINNILLTQKNIIIYIVIFCWGFLKGIRNHLTHLCDDKQNDEKLEAITLAIKFGKKKLQTIANLFFPLEIICLIFIQFFLVKLPIISISITSIFLLYWITSIIKNKSNKYEVLNDLHEVWLPVVILAQLVISNNHLYYLIIIHFLFFPYHGSKIYFTIKNNLFKLFNKEPVSIKELLYGSKQ